MSEQQSIEQRSQWDWHTRECAATKAREDGMQNWPSACNCTGNLPSNPLLDRLKRYGSSEPQDRGGRALCREAADEIERLTADKLKLIDDGNRATALIAERCEQLEAQRDDYANQWNGAVEVSAQLAAERDRLRAALERISQWYPSKQSQAGEVAREALAGAAVETTGQQFGPGPCGFSNTYGRCILMRGHDGKHELQ